MLQPINSDGTSVFKQGSTVPIKFRVCDAAGHSIGGSTAVVQDMRLLMKDAGGVGTVTEAILSTTSTSARRT